MGNVLTSKAVEAIFEACLFREGEDATDRVDAEGMAKVQFHRGRLSDHKATIEAMLDELPDEFKASGGGGWSFLNARNDKHGEQWTGLQQRVEQLFLLGIAIGKVKLQSPRWLWSALPGGVPYYVIN